MIREIKIKCAYELFQDYPADCTDEMIDEDMKKTLLDLYNLSLVWCHNDDELFDKPYKCKKFVNTPIKKGCIRIKYAIEETISIDYRLYEADPSYATRIVEYCAEHRNARSFIWCRDGQNLFKGNLAEGTYLITREDLKTKTTIQPITKKTQLQQEEEAYVYHDHPDTMENSTATFLYIIVMIVGSIFKARIGIWIVASLIYFPFIFRYKIRKQKWDKMQQEKRDNETRNDKK